MLQTHDNKAVVEGFLDAWNREDFRAIAGTLSSDYVNHNPPPVPGMTGDRDGMLAMMRYVRQAFPDARAEVLQMVAEGDKVLVHDVVRGTHRSEFMGVAPTGREAAWEFMHVFRVRDGKIVERWGVVDLTTVLTQIGASPLPQPATATA